MTSLLRLIREHYHPLFRLRKFKLFQHVVRHIDFDVRANVEGMNFPIYVSAMKNASLLVSRGRFIEGGERHSFEKLVRDNRIEIFWDVGANVGLYAFAFLSLVPKGRAVLFEPDRDNLRLLRRTIAHNGLTRAVLVSKAASDRDGTHIFYPDPLTGASGSLTAGEDGKLFIVRHHGLEVAAVEVETTTIDTVAQDEVAPDLIKIDTEGAEVSVLRGGLETLKSRKPAIFFEVSKDAEAISALLTEFGYILYDMVTLQRVTRLVHNNLALHPDNHVLY